MKNILIFITYFFTSLLTFIKLPLTFFQQDEWAIFGYHIYWDKANLSWFDRLFTYELYTHYTPLSNYVSYLEGKIFGVYFPAYAYVGITLQSINSFLVYYLAFLLIRNRKMALLSGFFFLTNFITHQAITWTATTVGTAGAATFVLLSLIFFVRYILYSSKYSDILFSSFFLLISFGFKETSLFVLLFIPILYFIYSKKLNLIKAIATMSPFIFTGVFYLLFRFIMTIINASTTQIPVQLYQPNILVYFYRIFTLPLKAIAQSLVPMNTLLYMSNGIIRLAYPHFLIGNNVDSYVSQTIGADFVSFAISFIMLFMIIFLINKFNKTGERNNAKVILSSLIFISFSTFPLIFIPGVAGYFSLFDGRHLYLTNIFSSILIAVALWGIFKNLKKKMIGSAVIIAIAFLMMAFNAYSIRQDINSQIGLGYIRRSILEQIYKKYPILPEKAAFFVESDTAYYGLAPEEKILPFQSGFGQTLLIWYSEHGQDFPACFYKGEYLYIIESEGYRGCEGRGFGYFRKIESLRKAIKENGIPINNIFGFQYNSSKNTLSPIEIRDLLKTP